MTRRFAVTTAAGLDTASLPWRLWQKAKRLGVWNPAELDLSGDRADWVKLDERERDVLLRLTALFAAGEEAVTVDLLPLIEAIAAEGRLEEEIYLTSFLFEEAKHVELFRRFLDEVAMTTIDLAGYLGSSYLTIFERELPTALGRLRHDRSIAAVAAASVSYNMIVEGVLAETGYRAYHAALARNGVMPGMQRGVALTKRDESRHIAYGIYLLSRLVHQGGSAVWRSVEEEMARQAEIALAVIPEVFAPYPTMPFGLRLEEFTDYGLGQFQARFARLERAVAGDLAAAVEGLDDDDETA